MSLGDLNVILVDVSWLLYDTCVFEISVRKYLVTNVSVQLKGFI